MVTVTHDVTGYIFYISYNMTFDNDKSEDMKFATLEK